MTTRSAAVSDRSVPHPWCLSLRELCLCSTNLFDRWVTPCYNAGMVIAEMTPTEQIEIVAQNMRARRKELGFTQRAVGDAIGVTAAHITQIETCTRVPDVRTLAKIASVLCTTSAALCSPETFSQIPVDRK